MPTRAAWLALGCAVACTAAAAAADDAAGPGDPGGVAPLFASREVLELTLEAPLRRIQQEARKPKNHDGVLRYLDPGRGPTELALRVRARGNFRRDRRTCRFPPLRLDLRKGQLEGTLFAGQNKIKLVTHCSDRKKDFDQYVLQEELAYRIFNLLTPVSFRTRLARIEYVDGEGRRDASTRWGFLIEHKRALADRVGAEIAEPDSIPRSDLAPEQAARVALFQLLIANTDWSMIAAQPGERCCHNVMLLARSGAGGFWPVPFDFDHAGMVAPPYAKPADDLPIRNVKKRLYRGFCQHRAQVEAALGELRVRRGEVLALVDAQPGLTDRKRKKLRGYLEEFFEIASDPAEIEDEIHERCR